MTTHSSVITGTITVFGVYAHVNVKGELAYQETYGSYTAFLEEYFEVILLALF